MCDCRAKPLRSTRKLYRVSAETSVITDRQKNPSLRSRSGRDPRSVRAAEASCACGNAARGASTGCWRTMTSSWRGDSAGGQVLVTPRSKHKQHRLSPAASRHRPARLQASAAPASPWMPPAESSVPVLRGAESADVVVGPVPATASWSGGADRFGHAALAARWPAGRAAPVPWSGYCSRTVRPRRRRQHRPPGDARRRRPRSRWG